MIYFIYIFISILAAAFCLGLILGLRSLVNFFNHVPHQNNAEEDEAEAGFHAELERLSDTSPEHRKVFGLYVLLNEVGAVENQSLARAHAQKSQVHIGCGGWYNFDIMAATRSEHGVIIDFNYANAAFIGTTLDLIFRLDKREHFVSSFIQHLEYLPQKQKKWYFNEDLVGEKENLTRRIREELYRPESWLGSDEAYTYIRSNLVLHDRITAITGSFADVTLFARLAALLKKYDLSVSTIFTSNIVNFLSQGQKINYTNCIDSISSDNSLLLHCPSIFREDASEKRLVQHTVRVKSVSSGRHSQELFSITPSSHHCFFNNSRQVNNRTVCPIDNYLISCSSA